MEEVGLRSLAQWRRLATSYRRIFSSVSSSYQPHFPSFDIFSSVTFSFSPLSLSLSSPLINHISPLFIFFLSVSFSLSHYHFLRQLARIHEMKSRTMDKISDELTTFPYSGSFFICHLLFLHFHVLRQLLQRRQLALF